MWFTNSMISASAAWMGTIPSASTRSKAIFKFSSSAIWSSAGVYTTCLHPLALLMSINGNSRQNALKLTDSHNGFYFPKLECTQAREEFLIKKPPWTHVERGSLDTALGCIAPLDGRASLLRRLACRLATAP